MTMIGFNAIVIILAIIAAMAVLSSIACMREQRYADAKLNFRVAILAAAAAAFFNFIKGL